MIYECGICGNTYDEAAERPFAELEGDWVCPVCGAPKASFSPMGEPEAAAEKITEKSAPAAQKGGAVYECGICGNTHDEAAEGAFSALAGDWVCPVCGAPRASFSLIEESMEILEGIGIEEGLDQTSPEALAGEIAYPREYFRAADDIETHMADIHNMALTGESIIEPMRTRLNVPSWNDILFLGAQLSPFPLDEHAEVDSSVTIGRGAKQPMTLDMPVYISHMSFGALSREVKTALSLGSAAAKTAMCSGEGGILPEERAAAYKYIFEYVPNLYSVTPENLKAADAIELKIGQGTKPGMGGHLPGSKVTPEIAEVRDKPVGKDVISPSRFPGINSANDLKALVDEIREKSGGRPVGIKIAAGHIERDLEVVARAGADFVTIDGRGGATGASPKYLRDASSVPTLFALSRARRYMDAHGMDMQLIITGGFRCSGDIVKALCMGADAVAIASAALMSAACMQYRVCNKGNCPMGALTQDPSLRKNLNTEAAAKRVANYLNVLKSELKSFCRVSGHESIAGLSMDDICTVSREISEYTDVPHV